MTRRLVGSVVATLAMALLTAGCGGGDKKESAGAGTTEATEAVQGESESAKTKCKAPATSKPTGLPAAFPVPGELTVTQVRKDGPTVVVDGYWTAGFDEAYREFKDQVGQAGYKVLFTEKEEHDGEISYKGSNRTGQIALRDDCTEPETTRVHITNRPA
jgi:hypothetical protein